MNRVIAVMVTFRPDQDVLKNIGLILPQVEGLVVVDNGSSANDLQALRTAAHQDGFDLIENESNLGVATALNLGAERAKLKGGKWLLLFDQDSSISPDFVSKMLQTYQTYLNQESIGIVFPRHEDRATGRQLPFEVDERGEPLVAITSGSLLPISVLDSCGKFEDGFIIDAVDKEYCLRTLTKGYKLVYCPEATMLHTIGRPRTHRVLGIWSLYATHHSAARRYYMVRNNLILIFRFYKIHPRLCFRTLLHLVKTSLKSVLLEEQKGKKVVAIFRGIQDALRGRTGKVVQL